MNFFKSKVLLVFLLVAIWLLLTWPLNMTELYVGAGVALLIAILPINAGKPLEHVKLNPKAIVFMVFYLFVFIKALIVSNIDVAFRVLKPNLPINPGIVRVKTKLKSPIGKLVLANSITLTPGTITVETKDNELYIHWIDVKTDSIDESTKKIVTGFEKYLEVIFG